MAPRKKATPTNNGRATTRDVLAAVQGLNERIDDTHQRIDSAFEGQQGLSAQMTSLHACMAKLEKTTNERLHLMESDITTLQRPWLLFASGWSKALAFGGFAAALTGTAVRLELWRFIPGL